MSKFLIEFNDLNKIVSKYSKISDFFRIDTLKERYLFGIKLEFMAIGAYIAMALDECIRGIISIFRWKSKKWQEKALI